MKTLGCVEADFFSPIKIFPLNIFTLSGKDYSLIKQTEHFLFFQTTVLGVGRIEVGVRQNPVLQTHIVWDDPKSRESSMRQRYN